MPGTRDRELVAREWSPECRYRQHAGGVAGLHIMNRVADEYCFARLVPQTVERRQYGLGMRFVSRTRVAADDRVEKTDDPSMLEAAAGECVSLTRDDGERMASTMQMCERGVDVIEAAHQIIVV